MLRQRYTQRTKSSGDSTITDRRKFLEVVRCRKRKEMGKVEKRDGEGRRKGMETEEGKGWGGRKESWGRRKERDGDRGKRWRRRKERDGKRQKKLTTDMR